MQSKLIYSMRFFDLYAFIGSISKQFCKIKIEFHKFLWFQRPQLPSVHPYTMYIHRSILLYCEWQLYQVRELNCDVYETTAFLRSICKLTSVQLAAHAISLVKVFLPLLCIIRLDVKNSCGRVEQLMADLKDAIHLVDELIFDILSHFTYSTCHSIFH